jgi:5,10-methylenetetrahydrofolate reductase
MQQKKFRDALNNHSKFVVIVELTGGPNFNFAPIEGFLASYKTSKSPFPVDSFDFVGITSTDNSGGTPNIEPVDVLSHIKAKGLFNGLDFIPHISCKDKNSDALVSSLAGYKGMGVESILVITGDKPVKGKRVFEIESTNLVQMINEMRMDWTMFISSLQASLFRLSSTPRLHKCSSTTKWRKRLHVEPNS